MSRFYAFIKSCRIDVSSLQAWQARFIYCYLIDALWFSSFLLLSSYFWTGHSILKYITFFCFALFTEILQLFVKKLGTFDIYDVFLYAIITGIFLCVEVVFNYKLRNRWLKLGEHLTAVPATFSSCRKLWLDGNLSKDRGFIGWYWLIRFRINQYLPKIFWLERCLLLISIKITVDYLKLWVYNYNITVYILCPLLW